MNPFRFALRYPVVVIVLVAMALTVGIHALREMPRMEDPRITIRTGLVLAAYPGATSEQVEKQVTKTLERHILRFPEVRKDKTYSTSRPGLVVINVELEDRVRDADGFWAKLRHELIVAKQSELPREVLGPVVNSDFGDTAAMLIAIHGTRYGYRELRDYSDRVQDALRGVRAVSKLTVYGEQREQIWITSSLERMAQYGADVRQVVEALRQRNVIDDAGHVNARNARVPFHTTGALRTEDQVRGVMVDVSRTTGQPAYLRDLADVERRYEDPEFVVRYDGEPALLLSVEMQEGHNIVELGEEVDDALARLRPLLPPDLRLDLVADQPTVVEERIGNLFHEFLLALGSVIVVTVLLLPIRIAVISAVAIPVTLCTTVAMMQAMGLQLHQVSIAALILVLGIVVDDAIVIADNYVELLDHQVPRAEAAYRCITATLIPVLTATLTIIASFLPLLVLTGSAGEFIAALPITVAVALAVSFVVATLFTPLLCRSFIRRGLHDPSAPGGKPKFSLLDVLQRGYDRVMVQAMAHRTSALGVGVVAIVAGVLMLGAVRQQFFPAAERAQLVIDVWMPQGTRIEATDDAMRRIEQRLREERGVAHVAAFVGQSAPRFYYNVDPQQPDRAYGQFIVNTASEHDTRRLVPLLRRELARVAPEALVIVKDLQQGMSLSAPVEIRVSGDDLGTLQALGTRIAQSLEKLPNAQFVHLDWLNPSCMVDVDIDTELANRLGVTHAIVTNTLAGGFDGVPVGTLWEGDRAVTLLLRLDAGHRATFENAGDAYVTSPYTGGRVPLRAVATFEPDWKPSRIVRRNGVRTLTVRAFPSEGHFASELLQAIEGDLGALALPPGYLLRYGGDEANKTETMPAMLTALGISLVAIFLVMLVQFRTLSGPLVVMSSIPLSLFGAAFGLLVTRNTFGFMAFMGLISLSGIVVRNAIILIDYTEERIAAGSALEQAAAEAGHRRLRPIFLTTMAAAVGVTPMILSGSSLWSPLASVLAFGLVFSMFFTLIVVPVLYVVARRRAERSTVRAAVPVVASTLALVVALASGAAHAAEPVSLTLERALDLAQDRNHALLVARARADEAHAQVRAARSDGLPHVGVDAVAGRLQERSLGEGETIPGVGPFPIGSITLEDRTLAVGAVSVVQPLTQLWRVRQGVRAAEAGAGAARHDAAKARDDVRLAVKQAYCALLAAQYQVRAAQSALDAAETAVRDAATAVRAGAALEVALAGARATVLQKRQVLATAQSHVANWTEMLDDLLGLPLDTPLELADVPPPATPPGSRADMTRRTVEANPEILSARAEARRAQAGLRAARNQYIPDVSAFVVGSLQDGMKYVSDDQLAYGLVLRFDLVDWGKRRSVVAQRQASLVQAEENVLRVAGKLDVEVGKAWRSLETARLSWELATQVRDVRLEACRLAGNEFSAGTLSEARHKDALAALAAAEADEAGARLGYVLAVAELERLVGPPGDAS